MLIFASALGSQAAILLLLSSYRYSVFCRRTRAVTGVMCLRIIIIIIIINPHHIRHHLVSVHQSHSERKAHSNSYQDQNQNLSSYAKIHERLLMPVQQMIVEMIIMTVRKSRGKI